MCWMFFCQICVGFYVTTGHGIVHMMSNWGTNVDSAHPFVPHYLIFIYAHLCFKILRYYHIFNVFFVLTLIFVSGCVSMFCFQAPHWTLVVSNSLYGFIAWCFCLVPCWICFVCFVFLCPFFPMLLSSVHALLQYPTKSPLLSNGSACQCLGSIKNPFLVFLF